MIHLGSKGKEADIETLLLQYDSPAQARAWMKTKYNPDSILYIGKDVDAAALKGTALMDHMLHPRPLTKGGPAKPVQLSAFVQMLVRTFCMQGKKASIHLIEKGLPEIGLDDAAMGELLETAFFLSKKTSLLTGLYTSKPDMLASRGFVPLSSQYQIWVDEDTLEDVNACHVRYWNGENLYPVYRKFMELFDASIVLQEKEFTAAINTARMAGAEILLMEKEGQITGFVLVQDYGNYSVLELAVYQDLAALRRVLDVQLQKGGPFYLRLSGAEPLQEIYPGNWKPYSTFCVRINDPEAFSRFFPQNKKQDVFGTLSKASWNFLL